MVGWESFDWRAASDSRQSHSSAYSSDVSCLEDCPASRISHSDDEIRISICKLLAQSNEFTEELTSEVFSLLEGGEDVGFSYFCFLSTHGLDGAAGRPEWEDHG